MIEIDKFMKSLYTMFYSWGHDTPKEVTWGSNEMIEWINEEYNLNIQERFRESTEPDFGDHNEKLLHKIEQKLKGA